ncbi:MAG: flagellar filament capping protein FliD [Burkholderiaceae bacterium]|nr:flagellar filament capping protein FliD [Burkholderiaceae bacterium]
MATTSSTTYDPTSSATKLATAYTAGRQAMITAQTTRATSQAKALTTLSSAMSEFSSALSSFGAQKSMVANAAKFDANVGTATAGSTAIAGTYNFYVERLATAGQVSYGGVTDTAAAGSGSLNVVLADGSNFNVNLTNSDNNHDGMLTAQEIASAINLAADNNSRVTASTLTVNGEPSLVLTAGNTGADNAVSLDTSGITNVDLKAMLDDPTKQQTLVAAQDAVVWIGPHNSGTRVQQASNTFALVDEVKMTFTRAQAAGESPATLTVGLDKSTTHSNVQAFVDAYNKLSTTLANLTAPGDPASGKEPAIFAQDSGLMALRSRMTATLRQVSGGQSLPTFGITGQRDGTIALDNARLDKAISANPAALDSLFGSTTLNKESGVLGDLDTLTSQWTNSVDGQLNQRKSSVQKQQASLGDRQTQLDDQYNSAYKRYLAQFTQLQTLQAQMAQNTGLFDAMFSQSSNS